MARPLKNGLDYFPFDTKPDIKMNAIIRKYGATGLGCLVSIYQKIYDNGYFIEADFDFIEDLCLELRVDDEDYLKEFIRFCVRKKIFHAGFYESNKILTSNGIQKRFTEATKRRKCLHDASIYFINVDINPVNACDNAVNADKSTQSKVKESKERLKESKVKENKDHLEAFDIFRKSYPGTKNGNVVEFENFKKKHKNWKEVLPDLKTLLDCIINQRDLSKKSGGFVPQWKNLQTWINQSCWTEEVGAAPETESYIGKGNKWT